MRYTTGQPIQVGDLPTVEGFGGEPQIHRVVEVDYDEGRVRVALAQAGHLGLPYWVAPGVLQFWSRGGAV